MKDGAIAIHRTDDRLAHGLAARSHAEADAAFTRNARRVLLARTVPVFFTELRRALGPLVLMETTIRAKGSRAKAYAIVLTPDDGERFWLDKVSFDARFTPLVCAAGIDACVEKHVLARVLQRSIGKHDIPAAVAVVREHLIMLAAHVIGLAERLADGDTINLIGCGGKLCCRVDGECVIAKTWIPTKLLNRAEAHLADHHGGLYIIHNGESVAIGLPPSNSTENTQP